MQGLHTELETLLSGLHVGVVRGYMAVCMHMCVIYRDRKYMSV